MRAWPATLDHVKDCMTASGTRCPPGPVLERITAPTPSVGNAPHRAATPTDQLTDEVLHPALERLRALYPYAHIPQADTPNRLTRPDLQRRVKADHACNLVEQWLTLPNPYSEQGHWYLHQLLFLPGGALSTTSRTRMSHIRSAWAHRTTDSSHHLQPQRSRTKGR